MALTREEAIDQLVMLGFLLEQLDPDDDVDYATAIASSLDGLGVTAVERIDSAMRVMTMVQPKGT